MAEAVKPFEDKCGRPIPVIAAGGIWTGQDIGRMLRLGAAGVQMATRFVTTTSAMLPWRSNKSIYGPSQMILC